jgi:hypothetical protein
MEPGSGSGLVEIVKSALVAPAGTVTLTGTGATAALLEVSAISAPSAGAGALRVTVPTEELSSTTKTGFRVSEET